MVDYRLRMIEAEINFPELDVVMKALEPMRVLAMLTGKDGKVTQTGLFVVRSGDMAKAVMDLKGRKMLFGPGEADETFLPSDGDCDIFIARYYP